MLTYRQAWRDAVVMMIKKPWSMLMTVILMAVTMTLPVFIWLMAHNTQNLFTHWQQAGPMDVYLAPASSEQTASSLLERIRQTSGVAQAELISSDEGLKSFQEQTGLQDMARYLPENPLPAVVHVMPTPDLNSIDQLQKLRDVLASYADVEDVQFELQGLQKIYAFIHAFNVLILCVMLLLLLVVLLMMGKTLQLAMEQRREEIYVLSLLGASQAYIIRPHVYAGVLYGLCSACLTILCVDVSILCLQSILQPVMTMDAVRHILLFLSWPEITIILSASILCGWIGAYVSVQRQLRRLEQSIQYSV